MRQARASAGKHHAGPAQLQRAGLPQIVAHVLEQLTGARFQHLGEKTLRHQARGPVAHRWNFNLVTFGNTRHYAAAEAALKFLRISQGGAQAHCEIVGEVIAADRHHAAVPDHTFVINDELARPSANIQQADAQLALIGLEHTLGAGQRLEDGVQNFHAGAIQRGHSVLRHGGKRSHYMHLHLELGTQHAGGIAHAVLLIHNELLRQQMHDLPIWRQRYRPGFFHGVADIVTSDLASARSQSDSATAVHAAQMHAANAHHGGFHRHARRSFGFFHCTLDTDYGFLQVHDGAFARAA